MVAARATDGEEETGKKRRKMERDYEKYSIKIKRLTAVELASAALALLVIFILFVPYF